MTLTSPVLLYLQVLCIKYHHNIYTLLASARVLRLIFVLAVVFIWTGELNRQRNLSHKLKCLNGFHKCPKMYSYGFSLEISKSVYFLFTTAQHTADVSINFILL